MTSSPHGPYDQGFTRHTMVGTEGSQAARWSQSQKTDRSPDCTLQLECMKSEQGSRRGTCGWITSFLEKRPKVLTLIGNRRFRDAKRPGFVAQLVRAHA